MEMHPNPLVTREVALVALPNMLAKDLVARGARGPQNGLEVCVGRERVGRDGPLIQIRKDVATDQLLVATPIYGAPAYKAETPMSKADSKYPPGLWAGVY